VSDKVTISEKHERTYFARFSSQELSDLLATEVARKSGIDGTQLIGARIQVSFRDETQGSPPYKVGTCAEVTVIETIADG